MDITINRATILDHSRILNLLITWFDEALLKGLPNVCGYTGVWLSTLISQHLVLMACQGDKLVGCIGLKLGYLPWNNEVNILVNEFLMTEKEARKLGVADKLIKAAKDFAKKGGLILTMGHFSGKDAELKDRYLGHHGFKYGGGNFFYLGE